MKRYDLVVVGAGPAGLMAAKVAAENGLKTALVDRKKVIPELSRPCTSVLLAHRWSHGEYVKVNYRDGWLSFPANGFSVRYEGPFKNLNRYITYSADGHRMEVTLCIADGGDAVSQNVLIDKSVLLNGLLEEAKKNHCDVYEGVNVTRAKQVDNGMAVGGEGCDLWGTFVIGADGVNSRLARMLGQNKERTFYGSSFNRVWRICGAEPTFTDAHIHVLEGKGYPSYFCLCPQAQDDEFLISIGTCYPGEDFEKYRRAIMEQSAFSPWFKKTKILRTDACVLSLMSPIAEPFAENCLLIGDASCFAQVSNHHALLCGWKAAHTVTVALINHTYGKNGVTDYLNWWKKNFFDSASPVRADLFETLEREEINYLFSLFKDPIPAAMDAEQAKKYANEAMAGIMPELKKGRPDLFSRMAAHMAKPPVETWEEKRKAGFAPK